MNLLTSLMVIKSPVSVNYFELLPFGTGPAAWKRIVRQANRRRRHHDQYNREDESSYESHVYQSPFSVELHCASSFRDKASTPEADRPPDQLPAPTLR